MVGGEKKKKNCSLKAFYELPLTRVWGKERERKRVKNYFKLGSFNYEVIQLISVDFNFLVNYLISNFN